MARATNSMRCTADARSVWGRELWMTLRDELIQVAAVAVSIVEDLDYGVAHYSRCPETRPRRAAAQGRRVIEEVVSERHRQDIKWGPQHHSPEVWLTILTEEVGEVARAILDEWAVGPVEKDGEERTSSPSASVDSAPPASERNPQT